MLPGRRARPAAVRSRLELDDQWTDTPGLIVESVSYLSDTDLLGELGLMGEGPPEQAGWL